MQEHGGITVPLTRNYYAMMSVGLFNTEKMVSEKRLQLLSAVNYNKMNFRYAENGTPLYCKTNGKTDNVSGWHESRLTQLR